MLPIQGPPLRPEARSTPLHQAGVGSGGLFLAAGYRAILLDDWLIVADNRGRVRPHLALSLQLVQELGFLVNWEKSVLDPSQFPT